MRRLACLLLPLGLCLVCAEACYGATEILVEIKTDVPCVTVRKTGIAIRATGAATSLGDATVLAESATCTDGATGQLNDVGSLVFVPNSDAPELTIRVVLGVDRPTDACDAVSSAGCITADRQLTYAKHLTLRLPIRLDDACTSRVCAEGLTCAAGACVSSTPACSGTSCGAVDGDGGSGSHPIAPPDDGLFADGGRLPGAVSDAGCPAVPNTDCACPDPEKQVCCFTVRGGSECTRSYAACMALGAYGCTDSCQCPTGKSCEKATDCATGGEVRRVCGGTCTTKL